MPLESRPPYRPTRGGRRVQPTPITRVPDGASRVLAYGHSGLYCRCPKASMMYGGLQRAATASKAVVDARSGGALERTATGDDGAGEGLETVLISRAPGASAWRGSAVANA